MTDSAKQSSASLTETLSLLQSLGHAPKKHLGQNFLVDKNILQKSMQLAEVRAGDIVVEVGPGLGTLSNVLLERGAAVWAVEKDATLASFLQKRFADSSNFHLTLGDALDFPTAQVPAKVFKIVANVPYAISSPWIDAVLSGSTLPERMVLLLQKENADRLTAAHDTKNFGALPIFLQSAYDVLKGHKVSPSCFFPKPKVDSYLLNLRKKDAPFIFSTSAKALIRSLFLYRRKQLFSILKSLSREPLMEVFLAHSIAPTARPESIPLSVWQGVSTYLQKGNAN
ncbi:MAG: ribosomal RNA small subunit methyltransferase A [Verrucomicrobia bacterium GWF2_51_19]|nr:MAG: ribosomal RNA small subunit methyltransferase A [Verrucomicrobia bacterium GWF2_51_19]HCJ11482.1 ribosomal RNA small subunit methyltransferase A [Opitutae bacterium]